MRFWLIGALLAVLGASGCATDSSNGGKTSSGRDANAQFNTNAPALVVPTSVLVGKVVKVNTTAKFVVLSFPPGRLPALEQVFSIYHAGLVVGRAKISGPQLDDAIVADLVSGEAEMGDEARD